MSNSKVFDRDDERQPVHDRGFRHFPFFSAHVTFLSILILLKLPQIQNRERPLLLEHTTSPTDYANGIPQYYVTVLCVTGEPTDSEEISDY
jgi:hypothetical protein